MDYDRVKADLETAITSAGFGLDTTVNAVLVDVEPKVELYRNGWREDQALHVYSTTASVTAALIGIAIDDQLIGSLDDTLADLLPRYDDSMSPEVRNITIHQPMDMTAGFPYDFAVDQVATIFAGAKDPVPRILSAPEYISPGTPTTTRAEAPTWSRRCCRRH